MTAGRFELTDLLRRGTMPAAFRAFAQVLTMMGPCSDYKFESVSTALLARATVFVIHGGGRTRL
jgi:hypothetical protein